MNLSDRTEEKGRTLKGFPGATFETKTSKLRVFDRKGQLVVRKTASPAGEGDVKAQVKALKSFPEEIASHYPQLLGFNLEAKPFWYEMPYYDYSSLRMLTYYSTASASLLEAKLGSALTFLVSRLYPWKCESVPSHYFDEMYVERMRRRLAEIKDPHLREVLDAKEILINGRSHQPPEALLSKILDGGVQKEKLLPRRLCSTHGQLEFDHILFDVSGKNDEGFVLLDTSGIDRLSDPAYDIGKMWQSVRAKVDLLKEGEFELEYELRSGCLAIHAFEFTNSRHDISHDLCSHLKSQIQHSSGILNDPYLSVRSDFAEAIHLCSAVPFYFDPTDRGRKAIAFYLQGVLALQRFRTEHS